MFSGVIEHTFGFMTCSRNQNKFFFKSCKKQIVEPNKVLDNVGYDKVGKKKKIHKIRSQNHAQVVSHFIPH